MSTGMRHGYWAALTAILGLQAAILLHLLIVALGLGALLASETAFALVKFVGAPIWSGWVFNDGARPLPADATPDARRCAARFVFAGVDGQSDQSQSHHLHWALVPQFIDPARSRSGNICNRRDALSDRYVRHVVLRLAASGWVLDARSGRIRSQNRLFGGFSFRRRIAGCFISPFISICCQPPRVDALIFSRMPSNKPAFHLGLQGIEKGFIIQVDLPTNP
jgi:homoserine/homoserine lactone efflux protein